MKKLRSLLVFVSLFVPFSYFNHSDGWNQGARLAELHAIVLQGTLQIDKYHEVTGDKAVIDGHYYSEKGPGIVMLALPAFTLTVMAQKAMGIDPDSPHGWRVSQWIATAGSVGVVAALGGVAFFAMLAPRLGTPVALASTYAVFLGALTFPYATALFAHAGTIGLLSIALWAAIGRTTTGADYLAGLCAGLAVASEYPAIIPCGALFAYVMYANPARAWRFAMGAAPAAILILANNVAISGSPFRVSYGANPAFPRITSSNAFGFSVPDPEAIRELVWGEYRGLFFWCPALLMSVPGLVMLFRTQPTLAWMIVGVFGLILLQVSSFYSWFGGFAVGPRYLSPALPFVGIAAAYGIKRFPVIGVALGVLSVMMMTMVTAVAIDPPGDVLTPLRSFYLVRVRDDRFADNLGTLVGAGLPVSLSILAVFVVVAAACLLIKRDATSVVIE